MEIISYINLSQKAKNKFKEDCLKKLVKEHKEMGLNYPSDWQITEHRKHLVRSVYTFVVSQNRYFYFKAIPLNK